MCGSMFVNAFGAFSGAQGAKNAARYQAEVARNNATISEWQAKDAAERGAHAEMESRRKYARLAGTQRAALASSGVDMGEGSALALLGDTDLFAQSDSITLKNNADREVWAHRVQGSNAQAQAGLYQMQASNISPAFATYASLLDSAGSVAKQWYSVGG